MSIMSVEAYVEHLMPTPWDPAALQRLTVVLESRGFALDTIKAFRSLDPLDQLQGGKEVPLTEVSSLQTPSLLRLRYEHKRIRVEDIPLGVEFFVYPRSSQVDGLLLGQMAKDCGGWILKHFSSDTWLIRLQGSFDLESFAMAVHDQVGAKKTICYYPPLFLDAVDGPEYQREKEFGLRLLASHGSDYALIPRVNFAIVNPDEYGGEAALMEKVQWVWSIWPETPDKRRRQRKPFPLKVERLPGGGLFIRYNDLF
jgi:hypothetical protein